MADIERWLEDLGLAQYARSFAENDIDLTVLPHLSEQDLEKLGVSLGHRKKLLHAIAAMPGAEESAPETAGYPTARSEAERRQLTVMFVDLVGSTELAARLDPEDMGEVIRTYHACCADLIHRWEGHVAKYMGDGVLAYFGWPKAHEDDAERAVRAGLAITKAVAGLDAPELASGGGRNQEEPLAARVGIATGLVMVGEVIGAGPAQEQAVVGETPNLAARLQALAAPGSVVTSQATRRLLGGLFEFAELGPQRLKGFAKPLAVWRVEREGRAEGRFEALHGEHLTPLVGRDHELGMLVERWAWAKSGNGQVVLLSGEPGIGKSRLLRVFRERLGDEPYTPLSQYCSPHRTNSALHPVIGLLERAAQLDRDQAPEAQLAKLEELLARSSDRPDEVVPLLAALLGIPSGDRYPALTLTPEAQKRQTLQALVDQIAGLAVQEPVLALYEDVHWSDPSTLESLGEVIERIRLLPVLVLITFRPEFQPPWTGQAHVTTLSMSRLGRRQGAELVGRITGGKPLPGEILEEIVAKTDGVPLFVEELTKAVLESDLLTDAGDRWELSGPLPPLAIPTTLHDSLVARLDRQAPVKEVAQIGAVIGRDFSQALLAAVVPMSASQLDAALDQLITSELVFRRSAPPNARYTFKHALVRDAAYASLLRSRRQQLHAQIAYALEQRSPGVTETAPEVLAHHFELADLPVPAIHHLRVAGEQAIRRSSNAEAVEHLRRALHLLCERPETAARDREELDLLATIGPALIALEGYASQDVDRTYARARILCERLDEPTPLSVVLRGICVFHLVRADYKKSREAANNLVSLAQERSDDSFFLEGYRALGTINLYTGELEIAQSVIEKAISIYKEPVHGTHRIRYGNDPEVVLLSCLTDVLWYLGLSDQSAHVARRAVACARSRRHHFSLAFALAFNGMYFHHHRREPQLVQESAQEALKLATEQIFPYWGSISTIFYGWALAQQGQPDAGMRCLQQGITTYKAQAAACGLSYLLALLAEVHRDLGRAAEGLEVVREALDHAARTGEGFYEAELHRLRGELLLRGRGGKASAEGCFLKAIDLARARKAKSWELRAATSLARLWADQGKRADARDLLAPVYAWFTEGFDRPDLEDARALLDALR